MKPQFEKFLTKTKLKDKINNWKLVAQAQEGENLSYKFDRLDSKGNFMNSVSELHGVSFIKDIIPGLIAKKKSNEKVRILDVGAGAAFFADEIRKAFPDDVIVFSTGLSKKTAIDYRKKHKPEDESKLHYNDLKWRSILELSNFEEFDLIVDTIGEFAYDKQAVFNMRETKVMRESPTESEAKKIALEYLTAIIKKLKPGGLASVVSAYLTNYLENKEILSHLESEYDVKIKVTIPKDQYTPVLRIEKNEPGQK